MPLDSQRVTCANCGLHLDEYNSQPAEMQLPCPACGSTTRKIQKNIHGTLEVKGKLGLKGRHAGRGKPFVEQVRGYDLSRKTGKWMNLIRVIDREKDQYREEVIDPETGEVVHKCQEPLSQHIDHGTAKFKQKNEENSG